MGFAHVDHARNVLHHPLDPWQEFAVIHGGELLPDGRPRFRLVLILVARQNGKTEIPVVLGTYWMFVDQRPMILGTSTQLVYAKESWDKLVKIVEKTEDFDEYRSKPRWTRETNGETEAWTTERDERDRPYKASRYKIAASNAEGGRSLTVDRLVLDELRQHHDYSAWGAAEPATSAVWDAQIWAMSNAGDDNSVVLNDLRAEAFSMIEYINEHGEVGYGELLAAGFDPRVGLFEWSCEEDADPEDIEALAQANPNLGTPANGGRIDPEALLANARKAVRAGGAALTTFKTEYMCIRVRKLDPAIDPGAWRRCLDVGDLNAVRARVALCIDVAPDQQHATLAAAAMLSDGRVRVEAVAAWEGLGCTDKLRHELPALLARLKPQVLGWLPNGPAASLTADLAERKGRIGWPPRGVTVSEIRGEVTAVCMGLNEQVIANQIAHSDDPLLNDHIGAAERLARGDAWVFSRKGEGHCDAAYAAAGAVHIARTMPPRAATTLPTPFKG